MIAAQVFAAATAAWQARSVPAYVSFTLPCSDTALEGRCNPGDGARFTVRMSDGRTYAENVPKDATTVKPLMFGGFIFGPGGSPLGFFRRIGEDAPAFPPPNLAPDPLLKTIASVSTIARSYDVSFDGNEAVDGAACARLKLKPVSEAERYPLRELWVDKATNQIRALTYDWDFGDGHRGLVHYKFAQVGDDKLWTITHIDAHVAAVREVFKTRVDVVSDDLQDIAFPASPPDEDFVPQ